MNRKLAAAVLGLAATVALVGCDDTTVDTATPKPKPAVVKTTKAPTLKPVPKPTDQQARNLIADLYLINQDLVLGREKPMVNDARNICSAILNGPKQDQIQAVLLREDELTKAEAKKVLRVIKTDFCHA